MLFMITAVSRSRRYDPAEWAHSLSQGTSSLPVLMTCHLHFLTHPEDIAQVGVTQSVPAAPR